ncbi:hypothetical protein VTK56DRAFT_6487 [Thermocarpiscus australiensis]
MDAEHQPTKKLFDAILTFQRLEREDSSSLAQKMRDLSVSQPIPRDAGSPAQPVYDQQITLGAFRLQLRIQEAILRDAFTLASRRDAVLSPPTLLGGRLETHSRAFLHDCKNLVARASDAKLPRLVIATSLSYARVAQLETWYLRRTAGAGTSSNTETKTPDSRDHGEHETCLETARRLLEEALALCDTFEGGKDFREEVRETMRLFEGPRYEMVTPREVAAIKSAMVSGRGGIATHSGHWYTCQNGHPVS